jgi:voltage-gated potassium channel
VPIEKYIRGEMGMNQILKKINLISYVYQALVAFAHANRGKTVRQKVYAMFNPSPTSGHLHSIIDNVIVISVLVSVICVILETVSWIHQPLEREFWVIEVVTVVIFSIEYCARLYSCCEEKEYRHPVMGRIKYMFTLSVLIDLLAIFPFYIGLVFQQTLDLRFLRVFRLARLLKLTRYTGTINTLYKAVMREARVLIAAAFMMILLVILTASLGFEFEHNAQPANFDSIPSAMYWAVITLSSVGYGDMVPVTPIGRTMTAIISLIGIGIFAIPAGLMASAFTDQLRIDREVFENEFRDLILKGKLSLHDKEALSLEAERLHLNQDNIEAITTRVKQELIQSGEAIAEDISPELLMEHFRQKVSQLKLYVLASQAQSIENLLMQSKHSSELEREIWNALKAR